MRILILAPSLAQTQAGAGQAVLVLANRMAQQPGLQVFLYTYAWTPKALNSRVQVIAGTPPPSLPVFWRIPSSYSLQTAQREMARHPLPNVDIAYSHNIQMALAYRRLHNGVPVITHTGAILTQREVSEEWTGPRWAMPIETWLANRLEALIYREPLWRHIVSTRLVAQVREAHFGLPTSFFHVCPLGVTPDRFLCRPTLDVRSELGVPKSAFVVVTVSRLIPWKRVDMILDAIRAIQTRPYLFVVGDGKERAALEEHARKCDLSERVKFIGWTDPAPYLAAANLFVLPSRIESFGMAYAEAMMAGLPCIGSRYLPPEVLSAAGDVIPDGEAGYTIGTSDELRQRIEQLANDAVLLDRMGQTARRLALQRYTADSYLATFEKVAADLVHGSKCKVVDSLGGPSGR